MSPNTIGFIIILVLKAEVIGHSYDVAVHSMFLLLLGVGMYEVVSNLLHVATPLSSGVNMEPVVGL